MSFGYEGGKVSLLAVAVSFGYERIGGRAELAVTRNSLYVGHCGAREYIE